MNALYLPHQLADTRWWRAYRRLAAALARSAADAGLPGPSEAGVGPALPSASEAPRPSGPPRGGRVAVAYAALARELVRSAHADLATAIAHALVSQDPPLASRPPQQPEAGELALLERDLAVLSRAARRDLRREAGASAGLDLPDLAGLAPPRGAEPVGILRDALVAAPAEEVVAAYLAILSRHGGGPAALDGALRWRRGRLEAVAVPAEARLDELVGLEEQLARLCANTEALLRRRSAHNVLLYGPRGSGKSTAVRGLLARYRDEGLRLVELPLEELSDLPDLLERLRGRPQSFVLFVDDLAFEEGDAGYRPLRTLLEGGLSGRPANVALYATSNRRHLLKERFSDRPDPLDDDVHRWDTQHEKLALADRFGLTVTFPDAGQRRYLELVRELARRRGIEREALEESAIRFAEWGNGYSGRTASQFIGSLQQRA